MPDGSQGVEVSWEQHLIVTVHAILVCIDAARPGVRWVVHKHPINSLAAVVEEAHLAPQDVHSLLRALRSVLHEFVVPCILPCR